MNYTDWLFLGVLLSSWHTLAYLTLKCQINLISTFILVVPYAYHRLVFYTDAFSMYHFIANASYSGAVYQQCWCFTAAMSDCHPKTMVIFCRLSKTADCVISKPPFRCNWKRKYIPYKKVLQCFPKVSLRHRGRLEKRVSK